jgi:hypothetical protein
MFPVIILKSLLEITRQEHSSVKRQAQAEASDACHFFRLPLELRQQIYRLALPRSISPRTSLPLDTSGKQTGFDVEDGNRATANYTYTWRAGNLCLFAVNQQINNETTKIFWSENVFNIIINDAHPYITTAYDNTPACGSCLGRKHQQTKSSPTFTLSKDVKAIKDIPTKHLRQVRHLFIVVRRGSDMLYEPEIGRLMATRTNNHNLAQTEELREALAEELLLNKMQLLNQGFKAVHSALNLPELFLSKKWHYQQRAQSGCRLQDVEIVMYPTLHLRKGSVVPTMDPALAKKVADSFQHMPEKARKLILLSLSYGPVTWSFSPISKVWPFCQSTDFDISRLPLPPVFSEWICYGKKGSGLKPKLMMILQTHGSPG